MQPGRLLGPETQVDRVFQSAAEEREALPSRQHVHTTLHGPGRGGQKPIGVGREPFGFRDARPISGGLSAAPPGKRFTSP